MPALQPYIPYWHFTRNFKNQWFDYNKSRIHVYTYEYVYYAYLAHKRAAADSRFYQLIRVPSLSSHFAPFRISSRAPLRLRPRSTIIPAL